MNLRAIDLNLLVVLDALLEEAHVSRAASRLGLSQPAASAALDRCRHLFGDRLLERGQAGMRPTAKAEALRPRLKDLLAEVEGLLDPPAPELATLRQAVRLVLADHPASILLPALLKALAASAPGLDLVIMPWRGAAEAVEALGRGAADLACSVLPALGADFRRSLLLEESYRVLMRRDHPAAASFGLEPWLAHPHVLVSGQGATRGALDEALAKLGRARRVGLVVPSFLLVPPLVAASDLIALLPSRTLPEDPEGRFLHFAPPIPVPGFPLHLAWHARRDRDLAVRHVAALVQAVLAP
ncbi:LysR family transcriptional regulator [Roseomonas frigidaquae]|uniref:LysR family transcriptional regulator n=1 Tax=Falsiroseomonas frigidaquae TaxID=487318 RepID=A0ABX1F6F7_9PROT|nr:LysR family transcriptional regulator [Falsiroseomonas frigidaquae]NKE47845.1 LysR family transcriptional regulator [Falsiroseomonas frigidaquae]